MQLLRSFSFLFVFILIHQFAFAAKLRNIPQTVTQPNGDTLKCLASGDEFHNWLHDKNDYTIVQHPITGYYVYAFSENGELIASNYIVGKVDPSAVRLIKSVNISPEKMLKKHQEFLTLAPTIVAAPKTGSLNNLTVFIRFSDESEFTDLVSIYDNMFNDATSGANSMYRYFREVSYDALSISSTIYPIPSGNRVLSYQDSYTRAYYQPYNAVTNPIGYQGGDNGIERTDREHILLRNAVNSISSQVPTGLNIDGDNDGYVDNICFIVKGSPTGWASLLWPHMWVLYSQTAYINSKQVYTYNFQLQTSLQSSGVGVLCHEMFHSLGSPDLYHYNYDGLQPVYAWDVMEDDLNPPQHMGAYMKMKYGTWISSIPEITTNGTYTLNPLTSSTNNCYKIASPNSTTEFFVVEYRKKEGTFESSLPGAGLLVYRINPLYTGNASGPPDEVYIYRPGGTPSTNGSPWYAAYSADAGRTAINDGTNPSSFLTSGAFGGLNISNVTSIGNTISFTVVQPEIDVSPDSLFADLYTGDISTQTLTINNSGLGELSFNITVEDITTVLTRLSQKSNNSSVNYAPVPLININKGEVDTRIYPAMTMSDGGPDPFGYRWKDSDEPGGPVFSWIDVSSGTSIYLDDDNYITGIPLGFNFNYYGTVFNSVNIMSNGWISFNSYSTWFPSSVPAIDGYLGPIVPFGYDLYPPGGNYIRYQTFGSKPNRYFVIEYNSIPNYSGGNNKTFEIILFEGSGKIRFQYIYTAPDDPIGFGIESPDEIIGMGNAGSGDLFINPSVVKNDYTIEFSSELDWFTVTPSTGVVSPSSSINIDVTFNASGKDGGEYDANIFIISNDPDKDTVRVPAHMHVTGGPNIALSDTSFDYDTVYIGFTKQETLKVSNVGTDILNVSDIASDNSEYIVDMTNFSLNPTEHQDVLVTFTPSAVGERLGTLTITSDDPDDSIYTIVLNGKVLYPPQVSISLDSLAFTLNKGDDTLAIMTITNQGLGELIYEFDQRSERYDIGNNSFPHLNSATLFGNIYTFNENKTLSEYKAYLNITTATELIFAIYESDLKNGPYALVSQSILSNTGIGMKFYSSGPLNLHLYPGKYYYLSIGSRDLVTAYKMIRILPTDTSFGEIIASGVKSFYPPPSSLNPYLSTNSVWYQSLTIAQGFISSISPDSGSIEPDGNQTIELHVNSGAFYRLYHTILLLKTNDPMKPEIQIPVSLQTIYAGINVEPDWNLISLPLNVPDNRTSILFPSATSLAFGYDRAYFTQDTLKIGSGYWLKFHSEQNIKFDGEDINHDTIDVNHGWNMIGSLSHQIPVGSIISIPSGIILSQFFSYSSSSGYENENTLHPGKGYWVKTKDVGKLIFVGTPMSSMVADVLTQDGKKTISGAVETEIAAVECLSSLMFTDAREKSRTLYFTASQKELDIESCELPPIPPKGIFDIRFASQQNIEIVNDQKNEFPIYISGIEFPLEIEWNIKSPNETGSLIIEGKEISLKSNGKAHILHPISSLNQVGYQIRLRINNTSVLPKTIALDQNFPNPFNSITTIKYQLTVESKVILKIFNVLGQEVKTLIDESASDIQDAGFKSIEWDARSMMSGVYFYRLNVIPVKTDPSLLEGQASPFIETKKLILLK